MDYLFNALQKSVFKAKQGAYSIISTGDEGSHRQITLTNNERKIAFDYFGKENIYRGATRKNPAASMKTFFIYNKNSEGRLKLNYPKPIGSELRLYMNAKQGFMADTGDIWFLFQHEDPKRPLVIGSMKPDEWESLGSRDESDNEYQQLLNDTGQVLAGSPKTTTTTGYQRNKDIALKRMKKASYTCEADGAHVTFISPVTGNNFVEPHHLIPMKAQPDFTNSLDVQENIVVLCPNCHRKIHYGAHRDKEILLKRFHDDLHEGLGKKGLKITFDFLKTYYNLVKT